jgi:TRAP-type C4-dicarboxylate transport system substrate-binding protein
MQRRTVHRIIIAALAVGLVASAAPKVDAASTVEGPKVKWNYAAWGNPKAAVWTIFVNLSNFLKERTGGKFTMDVHFGQLSKPKAILDGLQVGAFQAGTVVAAFYPGKLQTATGLDLPFLPFDSLPQLARVTDDYMAHPSVKAEFDKSNAMYYMGLVLPDFEVIGKGAAPKSLDDWKGRRIRLLSQHGAAMKMIGVVARPMGGPRVYGALDRGEIDAASMPNFALLGYKIYEIGNWYTKNLRLGSIGAVIGFNKTAFEALPPQYKALLAEYKKIGYKAQIEKIGKTQITGPETYGKAGLVEAKISNAERDTFVKKAAKPVWSSWVKKMNDKKHPGQELFDLIFSLAEKHKTAKF